MNTGDKTIKCILPSGTLTCPHCELKYTNTKILPFVYVSLETNNVFVSCHEKISLSIVQL